MGRQFDPPGFHQVEQGDYLSLIAKWYGFPEWEIIWNHPQNADLRERNESPNILFPGDRLFIPKRDTKNEPRPTNKKHKFVVPRRKIKFRLTVLDPMKEPRPNVPYKVVFANENGQELRYDRRTDGAGKIKHDIPFDTVEATLWIDDDVIKIPVGHLNPIESVSGVQVRLRNLGYDPGPIDDVDGPLTRNAVREFQKDFPPLKVDGICGSKTRAKLKEIYGA